MHETESYTISSIELYLKEVGSHRLLTAEEETVLGIHIQLGKRAESELEKSNGNHNEEKAGFLQDIREAGLEAKKELIGCNYRLVISEAYKYTNYGVPIEDLIQEGNKALTKAAIEFDPLEYDNRFSAFAIPKIWGQITRIIPNQGKDIRTPYNLEPDIKRMRILIEKNGNMSTMELANKLKITQDDVHLIIEAINQQRSVSLDAPTGEENDRPIEEIISSPDALTPEQMLIKKELMATIINMMKKLTNKEQQILRLAGINEDGTIYSSEEIAIELGISPNNVIGTKNRALNKLGLRLGNYR